MFGRFFLTAIRQLALPGVLLTLSFSASGQCTQPVLFSSGAACEQAVLSITDSIAAVGTYEWDFCSGDFLNPHFDTAFSSVNGLLNITAGVRALSDSTGDHVFICSRDNGKVVRVDFDNGFGTQPTNFADLGNLLGTISRPNAIQFIRESGVWHSLVTDLSSNSLILSVFGNGLDSLPTSSSTVFTAGLNLPEGVDIVKTASDSVYALIANFQDNRVLVLSFGTSILNAPTLSDSFTVAGADGITDIDVVKDCDRWFAAVTSYRTSDLLLMDLGSDLSSVSPQFISYSNGQVYPYGIHILNDGGRFYSFNSTAIGTLNIHELGTRLSSPTITFKGSFPLNSGTISGIDLIKKGSSWFGFGPVESLNILNTLTFRDTCSATPASDTTTGGATVTYSAAGNYLASLSFTDSAGNTGFASLPVQVNPLPEVASTITGSCFGDSFSFSDLSTLSSGSLAGTVWSYGDGDSALTATAVHVYPDTGLFDVRMISFTAAGCSAALDTQIYVAPIPVASFSVNGACSESRLPISDLSTVATGSLVDWRWEFGNGDTLSGYSPDYSYPAGGSYQIALTVTSDAGCTDRDTMSVNIAERPDGRFSSSNTCVNQPVQFIDLSGSSSSVITDRLWSFGDGDTSSAVNPTHIYPSIAGNYPLQLVVTAANGCTDTVFQDLRISNPPTVSFTVSSTSICERNDVLFTDLSTVAGDTVAAWYWDFGDGRTSTLESPVHRYDTAGTYTVTLIAYSPTNCPGVPYQTNVTVLESPVAGFSTGNTCLGTPVTFTDTSLLPIGASLGSIRWDFGNGDTSTALQPSITYSVSGVYVVTQTTVTTDGCTDTDTFSLRVYEPPAASFSNGLPCSGQPVQFSNTSTTDSWSSIATSSWDFGDPASGSANNSSVDDPSHVFSGTSTYTVQLIVTSNRGCSDTVARTISPLPIAPATFSYSPTCFGDLMEFFNPGSSLDSMYSWQFGDNQTSFLPEPAHFYSLPGTYTVTLSVIAVSGCVSTATRPVTVSPVPVAAFSVGTACIGSPLVLTDQTQLSSGSIVNRNWWAEGQGIIGTGTVAQVTYPDTGQYLIRLTVTSDIGCTDSISQDVTVHPLPFASFSFDPQFGNPPLSVDFDNLSTGASTYSWDFGDGSSMNTAEPSHVFQDSGLYSIRLVAKSTFGCVDTVEKSIYVVRPVLDIAVTGDSSFRTGNYFHIVARLSNLGTRDIDRVTIEAQLEDGSVIREKLVRLIPTGPGGSTTYQFTAAFRLQGDRPPAYYCIRALDPNDEADVVPENNEKCYNPGQEPVLLAYPNPNLGPMNLDVLMPTEESITIELYDQLGQRIRRIGDGMASVGLNRYLVNMTGEAGGTYTIKVIFRDRILVKQFVYLK